MRENIFFESSLSYVSTPLEQTEQRNILYIYLLSLNNSVPSVFQDYVTHGTSKRVID
jgi:hypothetical protein